MDAIINKIAFLIYLFIYCSDSLALLYRNTAYVLWSFFTLQLYSSISYVFFNGFFSIFYVCDNVIY